MTGRVAGLALMAVVAGCTVAGPRPDVASPGEPVVPTIPGVVPGVEPSVRIGLLVDVEAAVVEAMAPTEVVDDAGRIRTLARAGSAWTVRRTADGVEAEAGGETIRATGSLVFRPVGDAGIRVDGRSYRGAVLLRPASTGVTVVNVLDVEAYLMGVVPREIGAGRPPEELEAVKAQAVAARTYALRHLGRRGRLGFDLHATVLDQVYGGVDAEDPVSSRAVQDTRGEILVFRGEPIEAFYHSTCGGRTAALEEVWPGEPRPYLPSVSDARPGGGWYCETSNRFRWTEQWDRDALVAAVDRGLRDRGATTEPVTRVRSLSLTGRTRSGRAEAIRVDTDAGRHTVRGDSIRWILRPAPARILNSVAMSLETRGRGDVTSVTVHGQGWGHGIGMCQVGALGRARDGHSYRDILSAYYPGTYMARLYR